MNKITAVFTSSLKRGPFWGLLDIIFKIFSLAVWAFVMSLIVYFLYRTFNYDYLPTNKAWWISYCTVLFITSTTLAYTAIFVRRD